MAFDLLSNSALMRKHADQRKIVLGVNHTMRDFGTGRKKALDLVIARPQDAAIDANAPTFAGLVSRYGIDLNDEERTALDALPTVYVAEVAAVLVALEAKAAMTAHQKALPRLYDELNSSHLAVHGASAQALAIAYVQINAAPSFASSVSNRYVWTASTPPTLTPAKQPEATMGVLEKLKELPRRTGTTGNGFDGIGVSVLSFENLGGPVDLVSSPPAPPENDPYHYSSMIVRMANEYDSRFHSI